MHQVLQQEALNAGKASFGESWTVDTWAVAPGRIEVIGNHIDYSGGPVLAAAIDRVLLMGSGPFGAPTQISLLAPDVTPDVVSITPHTLTDWRAGTDDSGPVVYLKGIVAALAERGMPFRSGIGISVAGNIPPGFGMSSSAAFCIAAILSLTIDDIDPREMVAIAREAEHRAGSPVGAMDQSASVAGDMILFDGRDNSFGRISPDLGDLVFAVADSGVDRSLRESSYPVRVREAEEARATLAEAYGLDLPYLAAIEPHWDDIRETAGSHLSPTLFRRVRHVATETRRVHNAHQRAQEGDWETFGALMNASGDSSANDYEISHPTVEALVATLRGLPGVLGARMMGGGEGGPALVLLRRSEVDAVAAQLRETFYRDHPVTSNDPIQVCTFGPAAHRFAPGSP